MSKPWRPSAATVARWHRALKYFRFHAASGGIFNDADTVAAQIRFDGIDELVALFDRMNHPLMTLPADANRPVAGKSYTYDEQKGLCDPITAYPEFAAPGVTELFGVPCWIGIGDSAISIHLSGGKDGDFWVVTETDLRNARRIEEEFGQRGIVPVQAPP